MKTIVDPVTLYPEMVAFLDRLRSKGASPVYTMTVEDARRGFEEIQRSDARGVDVDVSDHVISVPPVGDVPIRIFRPSASVSERRPAIVYFHGGGWVLGGRQTHDRFMRELADAAGVAVVFVEYALAPEARFPTQVEQGYAALTYLARHPGAFGIDEQRLGVAGDSAGGCIAAVVAQLALQREGPRLAFQALLYPVVDASMQEPSYSQFAGGPWLTRRAMRWFWDAYVPDRATRLSSMAAPIEASAGLLARLPPTLLIVCENDVLRDEGERYARQLIAAGVQVTAVRVLGTHHDFIVLNGVANTAAARTALRLIAAEARTAFQSSIS